MHCCGRCRRRHRTKRRFCHTPLDSSESEILKLWANLLDVYERQVLLPALNTANVGRSNPQISAKACWDTPSFSRRLRIALPNRIWTSAGLKVALAFTRTEPRCRQHETEFPCRAPAGADTPPILKPIDFSRRLREYSPNSLLLVPSRNTRSPGLTRRWRAACLWCSLGSCFFGPWSLRV